MDVRSNEPYSLIKNSFGHSYPSLRENRVAEVLIIGAGITGALMAYELLQKGKKVIIVDKRDVCSGSTAASTSILQYEIDVPLFKLIDQVGLTIAVSSYKNCEKAIWKLQDIIQEVKIDCGFKAQKSIYFTSNKKGLEYLKKEFEARKEHGFHVRWMEEEELKSLGLNAIGAVESQSGARMDVYRFATQLLNYLATRGLEIYDKTEIDKIVKPNNISVAITTTGYSIEANDIVHCTGYESTQTISEDIVALKSTFAITSEAYKTMPEPFKDRLFWNTDSPYLYFRSTDDNRITMGGGDEKFKNAKFRDALLPEKEKALDKAFKNCFPNIPFIPDYSWAGTFGETKDGLPYFGKEIPNRNEHYILGFGGNGITFSVMGMEALWHSINNTPHHFLEYYKFKR